MDESEIEVDGSLRIPRVQCTRDAFFRFLPSLGVRDLICWALRTETTVRLAKIERREDSYTKTLESKYLVDVYPRTDDEGTKSNVTGRARDEYMFARKAHPQVLLDLDLLSVCWYIDFVSDDDDVDYGGLTPIEIEESKKRKRIDAGGSSMYKQGGPRNEVAVPPTMLHFEILLEAYCGYNLAAGVSTTSCYNSPNPSCPRSAVMGGAVVAVLTSYQDKLVLEAFKESGVFDKAGDNLQEDLEVYCAAKEALIDKLHNHFLWKERHEPNMHTDLDMHTSQTTEVASPFAKGDVDIFLQATPLTREILGVLEANGAGDSSDIFDVIGSFVGNAGICENDLECYAATVIGENGVIKAMNDTQFAFARSKYAISFILGKEAPRSWYDPHEFRGKLWPRTGQLIILDPKADLLGGLLDFDQSIAACSYDGVSVRIAPRAAVSLMTMANFVTPFCFEEHRNKKRVQKYSRRGFRPFIVDPNDNGYRQNLSCDTVITRKPFAPPRRIDYREHHDIQYFTEKDEIVRIQRGKMDDGGSRMLCCHALGNAEFGYENARWVQVPQQDEHEQRRLGCDPRELVRSGNAPYTQMLFEKSPGDAIDFFRQRFNWSDEDLQMVNAIDPYMRMACRKCKAEYNLVRVVMAKYPDLMREYDLEDDNLRAEFSYSHTGGAEMYVEFSPSFYAGGVFDNTFVRAGARPVDKINSMLHGQSIFEVASYVMKHGSPEGYLKRFVHSKELKTVFQKACKTLLRTPARPTVGLNPERFVERCTNCQSWLLGNRYGSKECVRCDSER